MLNVHKISCICQNYSYNEIMYRTQLPEENKSHDVGLFFTESKIEYGGENKKDKKGFSLFFMCIVLKFFSFIM